MADEPNPYLDPKGIFTGPQETADKTREFGAATGPRTRVPQNRRTPPRGNRTLAEPRRARMSKGSAVAAWTLAFIVVLYILGMVSQALHPDPNVPHPTPTVTVTHTVKAHK